MNQQIDTIIIGGGHAGLTMSYSLRQLGREHVILERGQVGERWRSERWNSFHFQFPNWTIELPGYKYQCDDPDAFAPGHEVVGFLDGYADFIKAPVRCGVAVISLEQVSREGRYLIRTQNDWVKLPIFDDTGEPVHQCGVTSFPGIYFLGMRWRYKRKSHFMLKAGPAEDAAYIADMINAGRKPD